MKEEEQIVNLRMKQKHCHMPNRSRPSDIDQTIVEYVCRMRWQGSSPSSKARQEEESRALSV